MMKLLLFILNFNAPAHALDLLQEVRDISCSNSNTQVLIDKKDRFIRVQSAKAVLEYKSVEFLDSGILLKDPQSNRHAYIQITPQETAVLLEGELIRFQEGHCKDMGAAKLCKLGHLQLTWSSEALGIASTQRSNSYDMQHYGVHPNDGTYFIAFDSSKTGLALLDFGANVSLIKGSVEKLRCRYIK